MGGCPIQVPAGKTAMRENGKKMSEKG